MTKTTFDPELIIELEKESGIQLKQREFNEILNNKESGYSVDEAGEVKGIAFYRVPMTSLPGSLVHFKKLEKLVLFQVEADDYSLLQEMKHLSFLDLSRNRIKDISFLTGLNNIANLYLGWNRLTDISSLRHLTGISGLDIRDNNLTDISPLSELRQLNSLDLQSNKLTDISALGGLSRLTYLNLNRNKIDDISSLHGLSNLTYLDAAGNQIADISALKDQVGLAYLNLSGNKIEEISPLRALINLTILNLSVNRIADISPIKMLRDLTDLDLSQNKITDISPLGGMIKLVVLNLGINQIIDISPLQTVKQLEELHLFFNQISDISPLQILAHLTELILLNNQISDISPLRTLTQLTSLNLSVNQISDISPLQTLIQLNRLNMGKNQISDISPLRALTKLPRLDLRSNQVSDISPIQTLTQLTELLLSNNKISDISPLRALTKLPRLDLHSNQVSDISPIQTLTQLTELLLSNNKIRDISPLRTLTHLDKLDLCKNEITHLPRDIALGKMDIYWENSYNYKGLNLYGNPLESPPVEIVMQGPSAVRNYFEQLAKESLLLLESKLLIVGGGEVGKTTLMRKLLDNVFVVVPGQEPTTHGIKIKPWRLSCSLENDTQPSRDISLSIWDFGGQAIYHSTHQFFLTKRSLYLFVWEARKEEDTGPFDYWLNIIKLLSDNSPVIVVMNKADLRLKHLDEASYAGAFPNIVDFIQVSCLTGDGIAQLTETIRRALCHMHHLKDELPKSWLDIRRLLEQEQKNYIDRPRYYDICAGVDLENYVADFVGDYLHDLGTILYFQKDPVLKDIVILNPEWATEAVYKLIDTREIIANKGRFSINLLPQTWDPAAYPADKHHSLMRLMEKFELCFHVLDSDDYIIPQLVPAMRPDIDFPRFRLPGALRLQYRYVFMPAGIVSRFIARNHYLICEEKYWQNGVQLIYEDTSALLLGDPVKRMLTVSVTGPQGSELLHIIRNQLQYIHGTLNMTLEAGHYFEEVPCNCTQCAGSTDPHVYPFEVLKKTADQNQALTCFKSYRTVSPALLLKGYQPPPPAATLRETLLELLMGLQGIAGHMRTEEDSRTAFLAQLLRVRDYHVNEQAPRGCSEKGRDLGRLDMEIRSADGKPVAILEAFNLDSFERAVIERHVQKIFGYDANGLPENVILVYGEAADFNELWRKYFEFLAQVKFPYPLVGRIEEEKTGAADIKSARTRHRRNDEETDLIHLFVNLFQRPKRKEERGKR